jgi:nucleoside-diphosphate-sugar epimerase
MSTRLYEPAVSFPTSSEKPVPSWRVGNRRDSLLLAVHAALVFHLIETLNGSGEGNRLEPEHAPERAGGVRRSVLDTARAHSELGWEARWTLKDGLQRTLEVLRSKSP